MTNRSCCRINIFRNGPISEQIMKGVLLIMRNYGTLWTSEEFKTENLNQVLSPSGHDVFLDTCFCINSC